MPWCTGERNMATNKRSACLWTVGEGDRKCRRDSHEVCQFCQEGSITWQLGSALGRMPLFYHRSGLEKNNLRSIILKSMLKFNYVYAGAYGVSRAMTTQVSAMVLTTNFSQQTKPTTITAPVPTASSSKTTTDIIASCKQWISDLKEEIEQICNAQKKSKPWVQPRVELYLISLWCGPHYIVTITCILLLGVVSDSLYLSQTGSRILSMKPIGAPASMIRMFHVARSESQECNIHFWALG